MKRATLLAIGLAARATALQIPFRATPRPTVADPCQSEPLGLVLNFNTLVVDSLKGTIDLGYTGRDIPRFFVLESLARVPYFSYLSCLHLYESLGMRGNARLMRLHYAEADNELHHLLIMESLGGSAAFGDRFVAQHLAFFYYWYCVALYLVHPRAAYHLSELIEQHAYRTYDAYLADNESHLKAAPVPEVARRYYEGVDAMRDVLREVADSDDAVGKLSRARKLNSLYDVFERVRDDEGAHWDTLVRLVNYDSLEAPEGCDVEEISATA